MESEELINENQKLNKSGEKPETVILNCGDSKERQEEEIICGGDSSESDEKVIVFNCGGAE